MTIVGNYENCGSRSAFYVIDDERGFKEFDDKQEATYAHSVQSKLEVYNLAPKVLSQIGKIRKSNGSLSHWGYITEIAEVIGCGGNECHCGECEDDLPYMLSASINRLTDKMLMKADVEFMDGHIGNVGYVYRKGKRVLVCIDFGSESVYDQDADYGIDDGECDCAICKQMRAEYV